MIYVECKPDFTLVNSITDIPKREIIHAGNKSELCKKLEKEKNCMGLVDEDPWSGQPSYIKRMRKKDGLSRYELKVLHDNSRDNNLVVICPRLEEWILRTAKEAGIDVRRYNLPNNDRKFREIINIKIDNFERLIGDLKDHNKLKTLRKLLERRKYYKKSFT
ncbi:MAG: hypothetical protein ACE5HW_00375 [Candidatus Methanofastidiosia archaeon]